MSIVGNRQSVKIGKHDVFKKVNVFRCPKNGDIHYTGDITIKGKRFSKGFLTAEEASKYVDYKCIENKVPQINNSFTKK